MTTVYYYYSFVNIDWMDGTSMDEIAPAQHACGIVQVVVRDTAATLRAPRLLTEACIFHANLAKQDP